MTHRTPRTPTLLACLLTGAALWLGCPAAEVDVADEERPEVAGPRFLKGEDPTDWVKIYDPRRAWNGYTLAFYGRRIPMIIDMNGRLVHSWPEARVKSRLRLGSDGSLLAIGRGRSVVEYDWDGNLTWEAPIENAIPHHDLIRLENGNVMVLILREDARTDDILEIDRAGKIVWEWRSDRHLADFYDPSEFQGEITHINSVQELPENKWFDAGDTRFRPGNLLISARNLDAVYLIDRETKGVVWFYDHELDRQHEALMVEKDWPRAGNIVLFDNGYASRYRYRQTRLLEIDPSDKSTVWDYEAEGFFTLTGGLEQPLPNGNFLVSAARGGRAFEIDDSGRTVWEWVPPFRPNRPRRLAYDHCPQLEALAARDRPEERAVRPAPEYRHVDPHTYLFGRTSETKGKKIDGVKRRVMEEKAPCRRLLIPARADAIVGYGIDRTGVAAAGVEIGPIRFRMTATPSALTNGVDLVDRILDTGDAAWVDLTVPLDPFAFDWIDLCLSIESAPAGAAGQRQSGGDLDTRFAFWANPDIRPRDSRAEEAADDATDQLTPDELEVQRRHLQALGYID